MAGGLNTDWDAIHAELAAMNVRLSQIAAALVSDRTREELLPVWTCGHRHVGRDIAIACLRRQEEAAAQDGA